MSGFSPSISTFQDLFEIDHSQDFQSTPSALQVKKTEREEAHCCTEEQTLRTTAERRRESRLHSHHCCLWIEESNVSLKSACSLSLVLSLSLSEEEEWDQFMGPAVSDYTAPPLAAASASIHVSQTKRFYSMAPLRQPAT